MPSAIDEFHADCHAFATRLSGYDNGTEVDTLLMAPEEHGVIGYNAQMDGFNCRHFRVPVTEALRRLAATVAMTALLRMWRCRAR